MNKEKTIQKKENIINALKRCLESETYTVISMQDVANEAGISKGGLRYYFPTKESLFTELLTQFFTRIEEGYIHLAEDSNKEQDKAILSTLFGIEQFVLNKNNIKIFINLILYGLHDAKIMKPIKTFFRNHLEQYKQIIKHSKDNLPPIDKNEFDLEFIARIVQVIFLSTGLLESVDPIGMNPAKLTRYVISLFEN